MRWINLIYVFISFCIFLFLLELASFAFYHFQLDDLAINFINSIKCKINPNCLPSSYQKIDPENRANYILVPGFKASFGEMIELKEKSGHWFGAELMKDRMVNQGFSLDDPYIQINSYGFRGPEIKKEKDPEVLRIMTLGDSCTFGIIEEMSYPRVLEKELNKKGYKVEVINAGVEGYTTKNVLRRLNYFLEFRPDIVTIYLGWHDGFGNFFGICNKFNFCKLFRNALLASGIKKPPPHQIPGQLDGKFYERIEIKNYQPPVNEIEKLISKLKKNKIEVVLFTLPSLLDPYTPPDSETLKMSVLPASSGNAFLYAYEVYRFNDKLRDLSKKYNTYLVDLERYVDNFFRPKREYLFDSVHLEPVAQKMLGEYIAKEFINQKILTQ